MPAAGLRLLIHHRVCISPAWMSNASMGRSECYPMLASAVQPWMQQDLMECNTLFDSSAFKGFCIYPAYLPLQGTSISNGSTSQAGSSGQSSTSNWELPGWFGWVDHLVHAPHFGRDQDQLVLPKGKESGWPWSSHPLYAVFLNSHRLE